MNNQGYHNIENIALVSICQQNLILLQTALTPVSEHLRLLFDNVSLMSYISPTVRNELRLPSVGEREVIIKTFGNRVDKKDLDVVEFAVRSRDNFNIYVTVLVSDICFPFEEQKINLAKSKYSHLRNLPLADNNPNNLPLQIEVLIGPVAVSSNLGFILSVSVYRLILILILILLVSFIINLTSSCNIPIRFRCYESTWV